MSRLKIWSHHMLWGALCLTIVFLGIGYFQQFGYIFHALFMCLILPSVLLVAKKKPFHVAALLLYYGCQVLVFVGGMYLGDFVYFKSGTTERIAHFSEISQNPHATAFEFEDTKIHFEQSGFYEYDVGAKDNRKKVRKWVCPVTNADWKAGDSVYAWLSSYTDVNESPFTEYPFLSVDNAMVDPDGDVSSMQRAIENTAYKHQLRVHPAAVVLNPVIDIQSSSTNALHTGLLLFVIGMGTWFLTTITHSLFIKPLND